MSAPFFVALIPGCVLQASPSGSDRPRTPAEALELSVGVRLVDTITSQDGGHFGFGIADLADIDGDGVDDFAIGALGGLSEGTQTCGYLKTFSGRDRRVIYTLHGEARSSTSGDPGDDFGISIEPLGDLDQDGARELLVFGTEPHSTLHSYAKLYSGCDGMLLRRYDSDLFDVDDPWYEYEAGATAMPDVDSDGIPDFALWKSGEHPQSVIVSGKNGEPGRVRRGAILRTLRDRNGDGKEEWLRYRGWPFPFDWYSPGTGDEDYCPSAAWSQDCGVPAASCWLDWDADGELDRLEAWYPVDAPRSAWHARNRSFTWTVTSLHEARLLHSWRTDLDNSGYLGAVESVGDLDGDGFGEFLLTIRDGHLSRDSTLEIRSTKDGSLRWRIRQRGNWSLGESACGIGDLDGDGRPDLLVGDHEAEWRGPCSGCVYVFSFDE